jgi:hypothetical protein
VTAAIGTNVTSKPFIGKAINGTVEEINRELNEMREGHGVLGKVAVKLRDT